MIKGVTLRDYQEKILEELATVPAIGLFIKTGGGKTFTSIERALRNPTKHLLVVCPQKIVSQWWDVLEEHTDFNVVRYPIKATAEKKKALIESALSTEPTAVVVNFDILYKMKMRYITDEWTVILDESHKIKNNYKVNRAGKLSGGYTTYAALKLGQMTPYKIILTATPAEKQYGGYIDYYTQLKFLGYIDYDETTFKNRYCIIEKKQIVGVPYPIPVITGYRMDWIEKDIKPILKSCCRYYAPKYGDYEPQSVKVTIEKAKSYAKFQENKAYKDLTVDNVSAFRVAKKTLAGGTIMGTNELKEPVQYEDNTNKMDWLEEFLSDTDDVVSVLYNYNVERDKIVELCKKLKKTFVVIDGRVADKPKELKKDFDVLIGQYQAVGESLDGLQYKCHLMVFYSLPDSSLLYRQSLGRIDRDGQKEMPIYYHLVMKGTIDQPVYEMIEKKLEFTAVDLDELTINY